MWNLNSIEAVNNADFSTYFRRPLVKSYCFSKIAPTIRYLFTNEKKGILPMDCIAHHPGEFDNVVLFFIDGFGWKFFEETWQRHPFLSRFASHGVVSKITSQFPSTTAAHVTSINTAKEVGSTGIYEWFQYEPKIDAMIAPLLFSIAGHKVHGNLDKGGISPSSIFPRRTFYQLLKKNNIHSFVIQPENIIHSAYSQTMTQGAHQIAYYQFSQGLKNLAEALNQTRGEKNYFCFYFPDIDSTGHRHGVDSKEFSEAISMCMNSLEDVFYQNLQKKGKKTAILLTADHGMVNVCPEKTIYINQEVKELVELIETNKNGKLLAPAGSCRDLFLHVKKSRLTYAKNLLKRYLQDKAEVYLVDDLIHLGFFGARRCSLQFLKRVGNLVILPYPGQSVWWYEKGVFEQHFYASHGGLLPEEMEIPFLFFPLYDD